MTKRYFITGMINSSITVLNTQGIVAPKFPGFNMLKTESDSPASKMVILS